MRRMLDRLYDGALWLAALLRADRVLVLLQILGRLIDRAARALEMPPPGFTIPSLAEFGAFLFTGAVFLGLAGTLQAGGHVRVKLLIRSLPPAAARWLGAAVCRAAVALAGFCHMVERASGAGQPALRVGQLRGDPDPAGRPAGVMTRASRSSASR